MPDMTPMSLVAAVVRRTGKIIKNGLNVFERQAKSLKMASMFLKEEKTNQINVKILGKFQHLNRSIVKKKS